MSKRFKDIILPFAALSILFSSCQDDDGILNDTGFEAEITQTTVTGMIGTPQVVDDIVMASLYIDLGEEDDLSALAPVFEISTGAVISPPSGSIHGFSEDSVLYTVTSISGREKIWTVYIHRYGEFVLEDEGEKPKPEK